MNHSPQGFLCPSDSPGKNTGVGCRALLQEISPTHGSNLHLLQCRQILYLLNHLETLAKYVNIKQLYLGRLEIPFKKMDTAPVSSHE